MLIVCGVAKRSEETRGAGAAIPFRMAVRDALIVVLKCAAFSLIFNAVRPDGLALVARADYRILVPCPETAGEVEALGTDDPRLRETRTLLVDARSRAEYERWHAVGAAHVAFDYLEPTNPEAIREIASSGASCVVVYGDGQNPDSGEQLAKELAGKGIRNVGYVIGGAEMLQANTAIEGAP